jgi:hypothetical protein
MYFTYTHAFLTYSSIEFILDFYLKDTTISDFDSYVSSIEIKPKVILWKYF